MTDLNPYNIGTIGRMKCLQDPEPSIEIDLQNNFDLIQHQLICGVQSFDRDDVFRLIKLIAVLKPYKAAYQSMLISLERKFNATKG